MGSGIVTALVLSNIPVVLKEVNASFLEQGINRVKGGRQYMYRLTLADQGCFWTDESTGSFFQLIWRVV